MISELNPEDRMRQDYILGATSDLTAEASKVKTTVFKNIVMGEDIDPKLIKQFLGYVNSYLTTFEKYADGIAKKMKNTEAVPNITAIPYSSVKDYLYANYDYASALKFIDGLINKINNESIKNDSEVRSYFGDITDRAFKDRAKSTAALVDEVITTIKEDTTKISKAEAGKFNAVKDQTLFKKSSTSEIYKTVAKVFEFLCNDLNKNRYPRTRDNRLLVSYVNNIIDYITYTITAYTTRVFIITNYGYAFIRASKVGGDASITESVDMSFGHSEIDVMKKLDEAVVRDNTKLAQYIDSIQEFLTAIGTTINIDLWGDEKFSAKKIIRSAADIQYPDGNAVCNALSDNPLFEMLTNRIYTILGPYDDFTEINNMTDLHDDLEKFLSNPTHALSTSSSAKQGLLDTFSGISPKDETIGSYKELASDVAEFIIVTLVKTYRIVLMIGRDRTRELNDPKYTSSMVTIQADIIKMLNSFYKEIAVAGLTKLRDIEMKINDINNADNDVLKDMLTIKIPGGDDNDYSHKDNMMTAVPDTERIPSQLLDLYAKPTFEYLQMCDEWASSLPGMEGDAYYTEASTFINKLLAWLQGLWDAIKRRWRDKRFEAATKWVETHQNDLKQMTYTGTMEVLPYKAINVKYIDDVINKLQNDITPDILKDPDALDSFIQSLYPQELAFMYDKTQNDSKDASDLTKYQNWVLFQIPTNSTNQNVQRKTLKNQEIATEMSKVWIPTLINADATGKSIDTTAARVSDAIKGVDTKFAGVTANTNSQNNPDQMPDLGNTNTQDNNNQNNTASTQNNQQNNTKQLTPDEATAKIQAALNDLWGHLEQTVYKAVTDQYKYIQEAHSIGRK